MKIQSLFVVILFSGCAVLPENSLDQAYFKQSVLVDEETSRAVAIFSTVQGIAQHKQNSSVWSDNFIRGFLDKRTGSKTYQVYNVINYSGPGNGQGWKIFSYANYQTLQRTKLTPVKLIKKEENCSAIEIYGQCIYTEHLAFEIDDNQLKKIIGTQAKQWEYHLISDSGYILTDHLLIAEIAGLLERISEYTIAPAALQEDTAQKQLPDLLNLPETLVEPLPERVIVNTIK